MQRVIDFSRANTLFSFSSPASMMSIMAADNGALVVEECELALHRSRWSSPPTLWPSASVVGVSGAANNMNQGVDYGRVA